jgi:hypothetical protein
MTSVPVRTPKSPPRGISCRYDLPQIANISLWNLWSFQKARGIFGLLVGLERHRLEGAFSVYYKIWGKEMGWDGIE